MLPSDPIRNVRRNKKVHEYANALPHIEALERRCLMSAGAIAQMAPIAGRDAAGRAANARLTTAAHLAAPSSLTATEIGPTTALLQWTDNESSAAGYLVLRATGRNHFRRIAKVLTPNATTFSDTSINSSRTYTYEIEAFRGRRVSRASNKAAMMVPPAAPSGLSIRPNGMSIELHWTDDDISATGYTVLRSTDGVNYAQLALITSGGAASYVDHSVAVGTTYYYEVKASNATVESDASGFAAVTIPSTVSVTTRHGDELIVTATGASDSVEIQQNGSTVTITGDGQTFTDPIPAAGIFLYTRGGSDTVLIDASVTTRTTLDTIDGAYDNINSFGTNVSVWMDSTDSFSGNQVVHAVNNFLGGVSKATGHSLPSPSDSGHTSMVDLSLWGTGPVAGDVNQGAAKDCYFLATLSAFANTMPITLRESAVDLGDGTYAVQFYWQGSPEYVRVSGDLPFNDAAGYQFAHPGANDTVWAPIMEKAFAYFRSGANTYSSLESGPMNEAYSSLGVSSSDYDPSTLDEGSFYDMVSTALASGEPVTFATPKVPATPDLVPDHAYTLIGISFNGTDGTPTYIVRNPWGSSGNSLEDGSGYANLTFAQITANFSDVCISTG